MAILINEILIAGLLVISGITRKANSGFFSYIFINKSTLDLFKRYHLITPLNRNL